MNEELTNRISEGFLKTKSIYTNLEKPFVFVSGRISPVYVDTRRLISFVDVRNDIVAYAKEIANEIGVDNIDVVAGGETAGIPYGAFVAQALNKPMIYIRKKPKGHGGTKQIEGALEENKKVLLIEDLVTDGGSKLKFLQAVKRMHSEMPWCLSVFAYKCKQLGLDEATPTLAKEGVTLYNMADWDSVLKVALEKQYFSQKDNDAVLEFLKDPPTWGKKNGFTDQVI